MTKISPLLYRIFVFALAVNVLLVSAGSRKARRNKQNKPDDDDDDHHEKRSEDAGPDVMYSSRSSIEWGPAIHTPDGNLFGEDGEPDHPNFKLPDNHETSHGPLMQNADPERLLIEHNEEHGPSMIGRKHIDSPNSTASSIESHGPSMPDDVKRVKAHKKERREHPSPQERRDNQKKISKKVEEGNNQKNEKDVIEPQMGKTLSKKQRRAELKKLAKEAQEQKI